MRRATKPPRSKRIKRAPQRMSAAPLSRLKRALNAFTYQAADEILAAFSMSHNYHLNRDPDFEVAQLPRADAADDHAARRSDLVKAYPEWRRNLVNTAALKIADMVLIDEMSLSAIDAEQRWRKGTAKVHLETALKHFASLRGNCPRGERNSWRYVTQSRKET